MLRYIFPAFVVLFSTILVAIELINPELLWSCCAREDSLFEWLTSLAYFACFGIFLRAAFVTGWLPLWCLAYALMFLFVGGEEISWGQRIFGIETPPELLESNVQQEFNLHNIEGIHGNVRLFGTIVVLALCIAAPLAQQFVTPLRRFANKLRFPVFPFRHIYLPLVAIAFMAVPRLFFGGHNDTLDEIGEFLLSVTFLVFAVFLWKGRLSDTPQRPVQGVNHAESSAS